MIREVATRYGTMFVPDTDYAQFPWYELTGLSVEDEYMVAVCDLLDERPKGVAVDVGANFGCWTLELARHATRVIAFEPQRKVHDLLQQSVAANRLENVTLLLSACGERIERLPMDQPELEISSNFGGLSLLEPFGEQPMASIRLVEVTPLDDCMRDDESVSFLKIDVEGFEMSVLRGARKTIARSKPLMFVEAFHKLTDTKALKAFIAELGYITEPLGPNLLCVPA